MAKPAILKLFSTCYPKSRSAIGSLPPPITHAIFFHRNVHLFWLHAQLSRNK